MNDRHWATDVTAGLVLGGLAGFGLPLLLHYHTAPAAPRAGLSQLRMQLVPAITSERITAVLLGIYSR